MWGTWLIATLGATVGAVLLVVAFAFGGWAVLVAFGIFAVVGAIMLGGAAWRRSGEYVEHADGRQSPAARDSRDPQSSRGRPRSGGAPASGEGSR